MALSSKVVADLKKKSAQAKKKDLSFFFFDKGEDKKPTLILGVKSAARQEKDALVKKLKRAPTARGLLRKNEITDGLYFRVESGTVGPLKKALKGRFKGVPLLKTAVVHSNAPKPEVGSTDVPQKKKKLSVKSLLKGGPKAFARRADKVAAELDEVDQLLGGTGFTKLRKRHTALTRQLASARAAAQTAPKGAYQELKTVKDRARKLTQAAQEAAAFEQQLRRVRSQLRVDLTEDNVFSNSTPIIAPFMVHVRTSQFNPEPIEYIRALKSGTSVQDVFFAHQIIDGAGNVRPQKDFNVNITLKIVNELAAKAALSGWGSVTNTEVLQKTRHTVLPDLGPPGANGSMMFRFVSDKFRFGKFSIADCDIKNVSSYTAEMSTWRGLLGM